MKGTLTFGYGTLTWETVGEAADPLAVCVAYALDGHPCGYGLGRLDNDTFVPWCQCEHNHPSAARDCQRYQVARREYEAAQARARCATLPAPEGATHLRHCNTVWRAPVGGACPTCGAAGETFTPVVVVTNDRAHSWTTVRTTDVVVLLALVDAGLTPVDVRHAHGDTAYVTGLRAPELGAALTAAGWACTVRGVSRALKAGAA